MARGYELGERPPLELPFIDEAVANKVHERFGLLGQGRVLAEYTQAINEDPQFALSTKMVSDIFWSSKSTFAQFTNTGLRVYEWNPKNDHIKGACIGRSLLSVCFQSGGLVLPQLRVETDLAFLSRAVELVEQAKIDGLTIVPQLLKDDLGQSGCGYAILEDLTDSRASLVEQIASLSTLELYAMKLARTTESFQ